MVVPGAGAVTVGAGKHWGLSLATPVIVKYRDDKTDLRPALEQLALPALVLCGRFDPIPLPAAEDTARRLKAELVVFEDSGHVPYVEETARFVQVLDGFLPRAA